MPDVIAIRIEKDILKDITKLGKEESLDRSTLIRTLIKKGYKELIKEKAAELYKNGKITLSEAAHTAELTFYDMEEYLISKGFISSYSIEDLEKEINLLPQTNGK